MTVRELLAAMNKISENDLDIDVGVEIVMPGSYVVASAAGWIDTVFSHYDMSGNPIYDHWRVRSIGKTHVELKRFFIIYSTEQKI